MDIMHAVNLALGLLLALCFGYQVFFLFVPFWKKDTTPRVPERLHRFAVLICARNEEAVIAQLIESIRRQDYPSELVKILRRGGQLHRPHRRHRPCRGGHCLGATGQHPCRQGLGAGISARADGGRRIRPGV